MLAKNKLLLTIGLVMILLSAMFSNIAFAATTTISLTSNGKTLSAYPTVNYMVAGKNITIKATNSNGVEWIKYRFQEDTIEKVSGSTATISVPTKFQDGMVYELQVLAKNNDGTYSEWNRFKFCYCTALDSQQPVIKATSNGISLNTNDLNTIVKGKTVILNATHSQGIAKIYYRIGNEDLVEVSDSKVTIALPDKLNDGKEHTLNVYAVSNNNISSSWYQYKFVIEAQISNVKPTLEATVNGKTITPGITTTISKGDQVKITGSHSSGIAKVYYRVGSGVLQSKEASSVTVTMNDEGTYSINTYVVSKDNQASNWVQYLFNIDGEENEVNSEKPTLKATVNGKTITPGITTTISKGDQVKITGSHSSGITKVYYRVGSGVLQSKEASSVTVTMNDEGTYSINTYVVSKDNQASNWVQYLFNVNGEDEPIDIAQPLVNVEYTGKILKQGSKYTIYEGEELTINASHSSGIAKIYYKIGNEGINCVTNKESISISIPEKYTDEGPFELQVYAVSNNNVTSDVSKYILEVISKTYDGVEPDISVYVEDMKCDTEKRYILEKGQRIEIKAEHSSGIDYISYKLGTEKTVKKYTNSITVEIPDEYVNAGTFDFQVYAKSNDGATTSWKKYIFEIRDGIENIDYPFIIQDDEKLNDDINTLAIALRTINTDVDGNCNYFEIGDTIQYNIDFYNGKKDITDKVYVRLVLPSNCEVKYIDKDGGIIEKDNTLIWTFNGLKADEKGTIVVKVRYKELPKYQYVIKPYASIKTNGLSDSSAVINLIVEDDETEIGTQHKTYMFGDKGTNTFRPNEGINRAEVAAVLVRIFDLPLVTNYTVSYKDADLIAKGRFVWAEEEIMTVTQYGLMEGYDDGEFKPGETVTRAQLITILARKLAIDGGTNTTNNPFAVKNQPIKLFNNLSLIYPIYGYENHWASKYLAQMIRLNMLPEFSDTINGDLDIAITRGEVTKLIDTILLRGPSTDGSTNASLTNKFVDVNKYTKYYEYILEATADKHNSIYSNDGTEIMIK